MTEQTNPADAYLAAIRDASRAVKLMALSELTSLGMEMSGEVPGGIGSKDPAELESAQELITAKPSMKPAELETFLAEHADDDIKLMRGSTDVFYFSERFMTSAYALHLFRISNKDPAKMVADTVRDDSRIYPRPTPAAYFFEAPFRMTKAELDGILWQISQRNDMTDIRQTTASDGSLYLYSNEFLTAAHADSLAEWDAVGQAENP